MAWKKSIQDRSHQWSTRPAHNPGRQLLSLDFEVLGRTYRRTDHYRPRPGLWSASWINNLRSLSVLMMLQGFLSCCCRLTKVEKDYWQQVVPAVGQTPFLLYFWLQKASQQKQIEKYGAVQREEQRFGVTLTYLHCRSRGSINDQNDRATERWKVRKFYPAAA